MTFSFPPVPSHEPGGLPPNPQVLYQPGPNPPTNVQRAYQKKLLVLINENMDRTLSKSRLAGDPWPWLKALEEQYRTELPKIPSFVSLQLSLGSTDAITTEFGKSRADVIIINYMTSVVAQVLAVQNGFSGNLWTKRAAIPPGLVDTMIEYNEVLRGGQRTLCIDILSKLYDLFQDTAGINTKTLTPTYFLRHISGQMTHSISLVRHRLEEEQRRKEEEQEQRQQEEAQRQQEEAHRQQEEAHKQQEEEQRQKLKEMKAKDCIVAISKGHRGTLQVILEENKLEEDIALLKELIKIAQDRRDVVQTCRDRGAKEQAEMVLQYLQGVLTTAHVIGD
jgi:FtsZ-interacting cell division protein YlmF